MSQTRNKRPLVVNDNDENYSLSQHSNMHSTSSKSSNSSADSRTNLLSTSNNVSRSLTGRMVNFISFSAAISTSLYISIGSGLLKGGPLGLLIGYSFWTFIIYLLSSCAGEMTCYLPVHLPYINFLGRTVDEALEIAAGYNFYFMYSIYIPFEITAVNSMIHYWRDDYSPIIPLVIQILLYLIINIFVVRIYGEAEFWLAISKLLLTSGLIFFTFIAMVGGNPKHDAFGFRNWRIDGAPLNEYISTGASGNFQAILGATINASFTIIGPELLSVVAGEAQNPRGTKKYPGSMAIAFHTVIYRLVIFYVLGALSVGILVAYNDKSLINNSGSGSNASSSPYVIAMVNLGIKGLPDLINAVIITAAFSAGNSFMYCSSRILYAMSTQGVAPRIFSAVTKNGVPIYCIGVSVGFSLLSLMQLGTGSSNALGYIVSLCTGSQVLNYVYMAIAYIGFYRAVKVQNINRDEFVYKSWFQPYSVYFTLFFLIAMVCVLGYTVFLPGNWSIDEFLFSYIMLFTSIFIAICWKVFKKTEFKFNKPQEADLISGLELVEQHEYEYFSKLEIEGKPKGRSWLLRFFDWLF